MTRRPKSIDDLPPEGDAILKYLERKQCAIRQNGTSHAVATSPINNLAVVVPVGHGGSGKQLPVGTFRAILKQIVAMGLAVMLVGLIVAWLVLA